MNFTLPIILIIISVGSFILHIDPEYKDIQNTLEKISKLKVNETRSGKILTKIRSLSSEENKISSLKKEKIKKFLPNNINNIKLIVDIERIINKGGLAVNINDISLEKKKGKEDSDGKIKIQDNEYYESVNISFSIITGYQSLKDFIDRMRKSLRVLDIVSLDMVVQKNSTGEAVDNLKVTIKARAYWLKK